jgi:hypothetical protein
MRTTWPRDVSEKLGYRSNGIAYVAPRGQVLTQERYLLTVRTSADSWPVRIEHLEACRTMFGPPPSGEAAAG